MTLSPTLTAVGSLVGALAVVIWRVQEGRTAVTAKKILIPPLGMATGFSMFLLPMFRVPWTWGISAFLLGAIVLAYPLLLTSSLQRDGEAVMMKRSGAFFAVVIVLAAVRYLARNYLDTLLSLEQTGALFYLLAFGMILRWRTSMYLKYRALVAPQA